MLEDPVLANTVHSNPELFKIVTPIKVDVFEELLVSHPNRPFVDSVLRGLREGFWPFANIPDGYPIIHDASNPTPEDPAHAQFLRDQRDVELERGRYSEPFDELLPGMYAMPLHAVPKDDGQSLRLVTNHSKGDYSLNSMVDKKAMGKVPLNNMRAFGEDLLDLRRNHPGEDLCAWKSDVSEAYRLIPMHPFWQVKQVKVIDGRKYINRCDVFWRGRVSARIHLRHGLGYMDCCQD